MSPQRPPGGIAVVSDYRVLWSWGIGDVRLCYHLYGRQEPCPRCPLATGPEAEREVEVNHPSGPREVLRRLGGLVLIVWPGTASPLDRLPLGIGTAVYSPEGRVEEWRGLHVRRSGVESGRAAGQGASRLLQRLGPVRVLRQVKRGLRGAPQGNLALDGGLASVLLPAGQGKLYHLLLDLGELGVMEPDYLMRPCFRTGGGSTDLASRLTTIAESRGWSYDISPQAAEGLPTWILPGVLDRVLSGILDTMAGITTSLWLSCSVSEEGPERWPDALPGAYHALDFEVQARPDSWEMECLRGLSARMRSLGGWVDAVGAGEIIRVAFCRGLPRPGASVGLVAFAGDEPGFDEVTDCAKEAGVALRRAGDPAELARLQPIAEGLLLGAAGPARWLPAALAARMPSQPLLVAGGTVHSASGPGDPEIRIPLPSEEAIVVSALRRLAGMGPS